MKNSLDIKKNLSYTSKHIAVQNNQIRKLTQCFSDVAFLKIPSEILFGNRLQIQFYKSHKKLCVITFRLRLLLDIKQYH